MQQIPITWQHCDGDIVQGDFATGTQTTLGSTTAAGWSASFDRVFNPLLREPTFHMQSTYYGNFTYHIDFKFDPSIKTMTVARWNGLFDVAFGTCIYTTGYDS